MTSANQTYPRQLPNRMYCERCGHVWALHTRNTCQGYLGQPDNQYASFLPTTCGCRALSAAVADTLDKRAKPQ